jgi:O-methyltransferase
MFQLISKLYFLQNLLGWFITKLIPPFLVHNLGKYFTLKKAFYLTGLEDLKGDYIEFGVFTGSSMACALQAARSTRVPYAHKKIGFFGFDSFEGFGELDEKDKNPFYTNLNLQTN